MATMLNPNAIQKGSITKDMIDAPVLDVKQNITDESLTTTTKTIVGAINEVYKGGFKDASIATGKIEDGAITEPKLDTTIQAKVNNNVKVVEQALTDAQIAIASKNLKFRDDKGNFFADKASYDAVAKIRIPVKRPQNSVFGVGCTGNEFGSRCKNNIFGNECSNNTLGTECSDNTFGNLCHNNIFGNYLSFSKIDSGVYCIEIKSNATSSDLLRNIHILSGVKGQSPSEKLVINIPDEYLGSSRELIITTKRTDGGPLTPEDIVMYYADEVADKQNKQDTTLATTSKEVVGAINEIFNGGVKDKSIEAGKLTQTVQDTLGKVGMNAKVLPDGTDLLSEDLEEGIYIVDCSKMTNVPSSITKSDYDYALSILIVDREHKRVMLLGPDTNSTKYPTCAYRHLVQKSWNNTPDSIYSKLMSLQLGVDDSVKKRDDNLETTSKEVIGAINELFNGGVKNKSIVSDKIADYSITMSKLNRAGSYMPDLGLSAMHNLDITLTGEGKTGSATLQSNGVTYDQINNIVYAIDSIIRQLGNGVTLIITEPVAGSSFGTEYVGTVTGVTNRSSTELSAIVKNLTDNKDYFVVVNLSNYEFITKISLTEQLPKIASLDSKVGMNVKEVKSGEDLFSLEDGIYSLNGSTYTNYPIGIPFDASSVCILVVTHSNQRATLYGVDGSHSSPILPLVAIGDLRNKIWTGGSFYSFFASDYEVGHKLDQKLDASTGAVKTANLANGAVTLDKIASSVQDTLGKVGASVKVLPDGTDLLSEDLEEGIYIVDCSKMTNVPSSITKSDYDYALSILIVDREHKRVMLLGPDTNSTKYPTCAYRHLVQKSWNNTPDSIYSKLMSLQLGVDDSVKKQDLLELTDTEVNNIWDNN